MLTVCASCCSCPHDPSSGVYTVANQGALTMVHQTCPVTLSHPETTVKPSHWLLAGPGPGRLQRALPVGGCARTGGARGHCADNAHLQPGGGAWEAASPGAELGDLLHGAGLRVRCSKQHTSTYHQRQHCLVTMTQAQARACWHGWMPSSLQVLAHWYTARLLGGFLHLCEVL